MERDEEELGRAHRSPHCWASSPIHMPHALVKRSLQPIAAASLPRQKKKDKFQLKHFKVQVDLCYRMKPTVSEIGLSRARVKGCVKKEKVKFILGNFKEPAIFSKRFSWPWQISLHSSRL